MFNRRDNSRWLIHVLGITGAYFLGRETAKNRTPWDTTWKRNTSATDIRSNDSDHQR